MERRCLNLNSIPLKTKGRFYFTFNHDESLLCWYDAKNRLEMNQFFLITLDKHLDLKELAPHNKRELVNISNIFELRRIIETKFHPPNVTFIYAAMELGIIKDALVISMDNGPFKKRNNYVDLSGREHKLFYDSSATDLYYPEGLGILSDSSKPENEEIRDKINNSNLIIDIDLDYFTYFRDNNQFVINIDNFERIFRDGFRKTLLLKAKVITVALEPTTCGGIHNSIRIFDILMTKFLKGLF